MSIFTKRSPKGFTLIELLVVIAIIGILSSVVLASLNTARLKSRDTRRIADIKQLQLAMALYFDSTGYYPTSTANLVPTYIAAIPTDPLPANGAYKYAGIACSSGLPASYHLGAVLEDTSNPALNGDIDATVGTACAGTEFAGKTTDCAALSNGATDQCYDVKP